MKHIARALFLLAVALFGADSYKDDLSAKEVENKNFVSDVMKAMKLSNVSKVILVCRSGPYSKVAANMLAKEGIEAYNLDEGFIFG